jgi:hypothetical protein
MRPTSSRGPLPEFRSFPRRNQPGCLLCPRPCRRPPVNSVSISSVGGVGSTRRALGLEPAKQALGPREPDIPPDRLPFKFGLHVSTRRAMIEAKIRRNIARSLDVSPGRAALPGSPGRIAPAIRNAKQAQPPAGLCRRSGALQTGPERPATEGGAVPSPRDGVEDPAKGIADRPRRTAEPAASRSKERKSCTSGRITRPRSTCSCRRRLRARTVWR